MGLTSVVVVGSQRTAVNHRVSVTDRLSRYIESLPISSQEELWRSVTKGYSKPYYVSDALWHELLSLDMRAIADLVDDLKEENRCLKNLVEALRADNVRMRRELYTED